MGIIGVNFDEIDKKIVRCSGFVSLIFISEGEFVKYCHRIRSTTESSWFLEVVFK